MDHALRPIFSRLHPVLRPGTLLSAALLGVMLGGCAITRLEDVPTTQALDGRAPAAAVADLSVPPDMAAATVALAQSEAIENRAAKLLEPEPGSIEEELAAVEAASATGAVWSARYTENGIDAENGEGDYCSGRQDWGQSRLHVGQRISVACSDGRMAVLAIESQDANAMRGTITLGQQRQSVRIASAN